MIRNPLASATELFVIQRRGETIILTPRADLCEFNFDGLEEAAQETFKLLGGLGVKNLVFDFENTDYFGSTALAFFVKVWKRVRGVGGRMAFCNVSEHEKELLHITHLNHLWPVCASRKEALDAVVEERMQANEVVLS